MRLDERLLQTDGARPRVGVGEHRARTARATGGASSVEDDLLGDRVVGDGGVEGTGRTSVARRRIAPRPTAVARPVPEVRPSPSQRGSVQEHLLGRWIPSHRATGHRPADDLAAPVGPRPPGERTRPRRVGKRPAVPAGLVLTRHGEEVVLGGVPCHAAAGDPEVVAQRSRSRPERAGRREIEPPTRRQVGPHRGEVVDGLGGRLREHAVGEDHDLPARVVRR